MKVPLLRRFRNELGEPVSIGRLVRHGPLALFQTCMRLAVDVRPQAPWIPFDAAARLQHYLERKPKATVLEYGSGMSTVWFAQHASHVVSVESNQVWAQKVSQLLAAKGLKERVRLVQAMSREEYVHVAGTIPDTVSATFFL